MTELHGQRIFEEGDVLFVHFPELPGQTVKVQAVKAKRDDYFCTGCVFFSRCREYEEKNGTSPIGRHCYTTIFEEKEFYKTEGR